MKSEKNPFSIYDFLGYFIPGAYFIYCLLFVLSIISKSNDFSKNLKIGIDQYFIAIVLCYIIGHIFSYLSSITIEVYSVWSLGYPSKYLLGCEFRGFWRNLIKDKALLRNIIRVSMCLLIFPVVITDLFVRNIFKIRQILGKQLDQMTKDIIYKKIESFSKEKLNLNEEHLPLNQGEKDFFRFLYHYSMEKCPAHCVKLNNYVALYGFTRTLCFETIILSWVVIINIFLLGANNNTIILASALMILSGIFYIDFNKFYRKFSVEAFMAFCSID